jgi:hypothetical protein
VKQIDIAAGDKMLFSLENPKIWTISAAGASPRPTTHRHDKLKFEAQEAFGC